MARAPKDRIRERSAYEFFTSLDARQQPQWSKEITQRGAVFANPPRGVYRTQVNYNPGLKRYLLNQSLLTAIMFASREALEYTTHLSPGDHGPQRSSPPYGTLAR
jgi:hypothetical protein